MTYDWLNASEQPNYYGYGYPSFGGGGYGALPWQGQAQGSGNILSALLKSGAAANYNFQGMDLGPMQGAAANMSRYAGAIANPDDPTYQKLYESERGNSMQDLAAAIAEMSRQNRKLSSMGRTPLFSQERGGEQMFRTMTQGYSTAQDTARQRAREILGAAGNAAGNMFSAYGTLAGARQQNQKQQAFGFGNIADAIPLLGKLL